MEKEAILHIPLSQFAFAEREDRLVIRLRCKKNDLKRCVLLWGDRVAIEEPMPVQQNEMECVASDMLYDYYEIKIHSPFTRVCYYFRLEDEIESLYYYGRGFTTQISCGRAEYFQFPYIRREDIVNIPEWAEDIMMYHIFPDSFANERQELRMKQNKKVLLPDGRYDAEKKKLPDRICRNHLGGTLQGIIKTLDYLTGLGINCIYLNPIFEAASYHKYDTIDYFEVDPCFGTKEDLKELVQQSHDRGIRVILDGVFNHCGADFFAFRDVREKGRASRYYDWFYHLEDTIQYADPPNYEAFAYVKEMPKLNTGNPEVADYLCNVGIYWIKEADIDGWRLDVANEINHEFWRTFRHAVRKVKQDIFLIGEIWEEAGVWLQGDQFDSTMNYTFSYLCRDFFGRGELSVSSFDAQMQHMIYRYPEQVSLVQMNFLDSHDIPRFLSCCNGERKRMELAFFYLFMGVGVPSVFYGDEVYIDGTEESEYRAAMDWQRASGQSDETEPQSLLPYQDNLIGKFKEWIALRREHLALRRGNYRTIYCNDVTGVYAFSRCYEEDRVLVVLNTGPDKVELTSAEIQELQEKNIELSSYEGRLVAF